MIYFYLTNYMFKTVGRIFILKFLNENYHQSPLHI